MNQNGIAPTSTNLRASLIMRANNRRYNGRNVGDVGMAFTEANTTKASPERLMPTAPSIDYDKLASSQKKGIPTLT